MTTKMKIQLLPINLALTIMVVLATIVLCDAEKTSYTGYSLYRSFPQTTNQLERLQDLLDDKNDGIEFWTEPVGLNRSVDIMASPEQQESLKRILKASRIPTRTIMYDVGEVIERTSRVNVNRDLKLKQTFRDGGNVSRQNPIDFLEPQVYYTNYQPYPRIEMKLKEIAKRDRRVTLQLVGRSYERRALYLVKVSSDPTANKPVIFLDAGHHAREWISHATLIYILESLTRDGMPRIQQQQQLYTNPQAISSIADNSLSCGQNDTAEKDRDQTTTSQLDGQDELNKQFVKSLQSYLDKYDFWFLPVVNPDGYQYTHTSNRLWRKTRSYSIICSGVDPNRNYPFHWRESGASSFACDETYAGPRALSEPETRTLAELLDENQKRIVMYLTLHAYSQLMLVPYGYARVYPENYDEMKRVAQAGMSAIQSVRGTRYMFGTSSIMLYPAAGGSDDYALGHAKIKLSYTIELPDTGNYGFLLPPSEIIPVGQETVQGISAMLDAMDS